MPRPLRILHTEWSDGWGGQEIRIVNEMAGMQARGHEVILATREQCTIATKAAQRGIEVHTFPFASKFDPRTTFALKQFIHDRHIDICNTHSGLDSWVGGIAARLAGTGLVRTRHLDIPLKRSWHNFIHYLPHKIVTCGNNTLIKLRDQCHFPVEQLTSIPTGVDFECFQPHQDAAMTRSALGIPENDFILLMVGVIRSVKRYDLAIEAFKRIHDARKNTWLVIAGDGPGKSRMMALAEQLGIEDHVKFLGHRDDIPDLMASANALMLSSDSEGIPQAVTQAMGSGLPVVATHVGGVSELITHQKTGFLAQKGSIDQLAEHALYVIDHPDAAEQVAKDGQRHVLEHFSLNAMLDKTEQVYAGILGKLKS